MPKENSGRPGGNPDIRDTTKVPRTGPKILANKIKSVVLSGLMTNGQHSKLLPKIMKCSNCPLGAKQKAIIVRGKLQHIPEPAKCSFFSVDREKCVLEPEKFIKRLKTYWICEKYGWDEVKIAEALAFDSIADAGLAREVEMLTKGHPGFYTNVFQESASKQIQALHKMKYGETTRNLNVNMDVSDKIVQAYAERKKKDDDEKEDNS